MKSQKGFTLIEVVVVIAVIGIIILFAVPNIRGYIESNNERHRQTQEQLVNKTFMQYYALTGKHFTTTCDADDFIIGVEGMYNELNSKAGSLLSNSTGNYRYKVIDGTEDPITSIVTVRKIEAHRVS